MRYVSRFALGVEIGLQAIVFALWSWAYLEADVASIVLFYLGCLVEVGALALAAAITVIVIIEKRQS